MSHEGIYMRDYVGFVYLWYDCKKKRFYLGSHMGSAQSRYVCSSKNMKKAYARRPETFKRRIIHWHTDECRKSLYAVEEKWLALIKEEELGKRYYNLHRSGGGFDGAHTRKLWAQKDHREKHVQSMKKAWTPERKAAHSEKMRQKWQEAEFRKKVDGHSERTKAVWADPEKGENMRAAVKKHHDSYVYSDETRSKMSESARKRVTLEWKIQTVARMVAANDGSGGRAHSGKRWYNDGRSSSRFFPGSEPEGWALGRFRKG
jgi:hypothetical protein